MTVDTSEVSVIYERSCASLVGLLTSIGGSHSDAEEIAHDAFAKLLARWEKIRRYDDPEAWLRMVAVRDLISRKRREQTRMRGLRRLAARPLWQPEAPNPDRVALDLALKSLPINHRAALVLHYGLDLSVESVAEILDVPIGTVKSRLARGRKALTPLLRDEEMTSHE